MESIVGTNSHLKVTQEPVVVTIISEPFVVLSYRGYCPVVRVRLENGTEPLMFISAKTFAAGVNEHLGGPQKDQFLGLKLRLSRDGEGVYAPFIVEVL